MLDSSLDDMALAAYLDGTLSEPDRDRVEAGLTASTEAAELWLAARESLAAAAPEVPEAVVRRAQGLVPAPIATRATGRPPSFGLWLSGLAEIFAPTLGSLPRPVGAALAVVALVVVSASGFELGRTGYGNLAGGPPQVEADDDLGFGDEII